MTIILILLGSLIGTKEVNAQSVSFHETDYIQGVWQHRKNENGIIYYQKARYIERQDGVKAYCIEPFRTLDESTTYEESMQINGMSQDMWKRIYLTAYYGYGYENHTDPKWYAITQLLIWQIAEPTATMYFADQPLGENNHQFDQEINEINTLVQNHDQKPSFGGTIYTILKGDKETIVDHNNVLANFQMTNGKNNISKNNNELTIEATTKGKDRIYFTKESNQYQIPPLFYHHPTSQDIVVVGDYYPIKTDLYINVLTGKIIVQKKIEELDPPYQNNATLEGTVFELFDEQHHKLEEKPLDENNQVVFEDLGKGTYYVKEKSTGEGYELNKEEVKVDISRSYLKKEIMIENKIIKNKIEIYKQYGKEENWKDEEGITFAILSQTGEIIQEITTDEKGYASITLPYGTYLIHQINTKEGFEEVEDFTIEVTKESDLTQTYHLKNYEIDVPDTMKNQIEKKWNLGEWIDDQKKKYYRNHFTLN